MMAITGGPELSPEEFPQVQTLEQIQLMATGNTARPSGPVVSPHCRKQADQQLSAAARMGSSFGLYPAIEITLHLDNVCAAKWAAPTALESASRDRHRGTNLLPSTQLVRIFER
jgi:hypothetical protein